MVFNGFLNGDSMGFNGDSMGFHDDSMGAQGDDSGFDDDLMGNIMGISFQYNMEIVGSMIYFLVA